MSFYAGLNAINQPGLEVLVHSSARDIASISEKFND
jgi:hypothetical protein